MVYFQLKQVIQNIGLVLGAHQLGVDMNSTGILQETVCYIQDGAMVNHIKVKLELIAYLHMGKVTGDGMIMHAQCL